MKSFRGLIVLIVLGLFVSGVMAQALQFRLTNEQDIGFACPVTSAVTPTTGQLWVLMDDCYYSAYSLQAYDLITNEPLIDEPITLDTIDAMLYGIESSVKPLIFIDDTTLELIAFDWESYDLARFEIDILTGDVSYDETGSQTLTETLRAHTEYVEYATFSPDHRYALATDDLNSYLIDLSSGNVLKTFPDTLNFASYSADGQLVYITEFEDPENYDNNNGILSVYELPIQPDSEPIDERIIPSVFVFPSPDNATFALQIGDDQLAVYDPATDELSPALMMWEEPRHAETCLNTGADISDVDFTVSGRLTLSSVQWLPDSSGFITLNSYGGEGAEGGTLCLFNYSRLRQYQLGG